jgi:hypothetical protein
MQHRDPHVLLALDESKHREDCQANTKHVLELVRPAETAVYNANWIQKPAIMAATSALVHSEVSQLTSLTSFSIALQVSWIEGTTSVPMFPVTGQWIWKHTARPCDFWLVHNCVVVQQDMLHEALCTPQCSWAKCAVFGKR